MRDRWARLNIVVQVCFLLVVGAVLLGAVAQVGTLITAGPIQAIRVVDGLSNQMAAVDHSGAFGVTNAPSTTLAVTNATQGGLVADSSNRFVVAHVSSLTHVSGLVSVRDDTCPTCKARVDHYNALANQPHISGALRIWTVNQCGGTAATAVATNENRRDLIVKNVGTTANVLIFVGYGTTGHVALSAANGFPLTQHEASTGSPINAVLALTNYQGPLSCISTSAGMTLLVTEILR